MEIELLSLIFMPNFELINSFSESHKLKINAFFERQRLVVKGRDATGNRQVALAKGEIVANPAGICTHISISCYPHFLSVLYKTPAECESCHYVTSFSV